MIGDYEALTKFIRKEIIDANLEINYLKITRSTILSITRQFEELGWSVEAVIDDTSRHQRHKIISPDGNLTLSMIGGKVYRHPAFTEQICRRKHLTKRMLELESLPIAAGGDFSPREREIATAYFKKLPKPVVVKPTDSGGSEGVTIGVSNPAEFETAWVHALAGARKNSNVLVEQFVRGVELRAYVIGDEVVSVVARIQPFVVGTGKNSLDELIKELNETRKIHYRAMKMPVIIDWDFVNKLGFEGNSVPEIDKIVFLSPLCLPSAGAFLVDVTRSVCNEIKDIARRAKDAIPHLEMAGVDILVEDLDDPNTAYVLEVNTSASLDLHRYPTHGDSRAIDEDIVNYFHEIYLNGKSDL